MAKVPSTQFGDAIRDARKALNISLREAAKRLDISPAYLSSLENNTEGSTPKEELLQNMSKLLKLNLAEMKRLTIGISKDNLRSLERVIAPSEAQEIQAFYRVAKENNLSTKRALEIFTNAVEQYNQQRGK